MKIATYVPSFPTLKLLNLLGNSKFKKDKLREIYGETDMKFFYLGRTAIWNAVKLLGLEPEDNILMPAYHCSVEVDAVCQMNVKIRFFEVKSDMSVDLNDLEKKIDDRTKAVFVIHYFGFPQPVDKIKSLCDNRKLYLIEDCAHAFLSLFHNKPLGSYGDLGILSIQKFLPLPSGGVLLTNNSKLRLPIGLISPDKRLIARKLLFLLLKGLKVNNGYLYRLIKLSFISPVTNIKRLLKGYSDSGIAGLGPMKFNREISNLSMSILSKKLVNNFRLNDIISRRRTNYNLLIEKLKNIRGIKICHLYLPDGTCPWFLPIELENRDAIHKKLLQRNIETFIFGEFLHDLLPAEGFNNAKLLSRNILALPIHQDIRPGHIDYLTENLRKMLATY